MDTVQLCRLEKSLPPKAMTGDAIYFDTAGATDPLMSGQLWPLRFIVLYTCAESLFRFYFSKIKMKKTFLDTNYE